MTRFLLFLALCFALAGCPKGGGPSPSPDTVISGPSDEMKENVAILEPIKEPELADFFDQFAVVVEEDADSKIIATTGQLRAVYSDGGVLRFHKSLKGKYPTLGNDVDNVFFTVLGKQNGPFERTVAVDMLRAIAWAVR